MRGRWRRPLAFLLSAAMIGSLTGAPIRAAAEGGTASDGLCEHHTEHNEECGYAEDTPCAFVCGECASAEADRQSERDEEPGSEPDNGLGEEPGKEPDTELDTETEEAPKTEPGVEPDTEPGVGLDTEPSAEPGVGLDTEPSAEPGVGLNTGADTEPGVEADTEPVAEPDEEPDTETDTAVRVMSWRFVEDSEGLVLIEDEDGVTVQIPPSEGGVPFEQLTEMLPGEIEAEVLSSESDDSVLETITIEITGWECEEYTSETLTGEEGQEETVWPSTGEYLFTAQIGEGYIFEESPSLTVGFAAPMMTTFALTSEQAGWDEETKTYTVIGTEGYPAASKVQDLKAGATLDLSQAESYTLPDGTTSHSTLMFRAKGDLKIIGPEDRELTFERRSLISMPEDSTLTLKNLKWTDFNMYSEYSLGAAETVIYEGDCALPSIYVADKDTITFQPYGADDTLELEEYRYTGTAEGADVVFDGGTVQVNQGISARSVTIKNHCDLTNEGENAYGIHFKNKYTGFMKITDSTIKITAEKRYNGTQQYPALGGEVNPQYDIGYTTNDAYNRFYYTMANEPDRIESCIQIENSDISVNTDAVSYGGIGGAGKIIITGSEVNVSSQCGEGLVNYYTAGIGVVFKDIIISDSTVTSAGYNGAGIGTGHEGFHLSENENMSALSKLKGTITIENSTVIASSTNGAGIGVNPVWNYFGEFGDRPQPMGVIIKGDSNVTARSVNGAGIGGGRNNRTISDPNAVIINPGVSGWGDGGTAGIETFSLRMARQSTAIGDSGIPMTINNVKNYVLSDAQTLTVEDSPTILAESGVCAISSETVSTSVTIVQNTVETAPKLTVPIYVGETNLGDLREDFKSIARTAGDISEGTYALWYGTGDDHDPLVNWNTEAGTVYSAGPFEVKAGTINRFWTLPVQKLGGRAGVSTSSSAPASATVSTSTVNTKLYVNIKSLTPSDVRSNTAEKRKTLSYQWYRDGVPLEGATGTNYSPTEPGIYHYVITGSDRYRGEIVSSVVNVTAADVTAPAAPVVDGYDQTSITLKAPTDGKTYEYSIDGGANWQDDRTFTGLTPNTQYSIIRREKGNPPGMASVPRNVTTWGDRPSEEMILEAIDYETEKFDSTKLPPNVELYTKPSYTSTNKFSVGNDTLTAYISDAGEEEQYLYAKYTGSSLVTAVKIPARPQAPELTAADILPTQDSIQVTGIPGAEYNYARTGETPANGTAQICGEDGKVTFTGLSSNTEYTIYARIPASNEEKRFHSAEISVKGRTPAAGTLSATILIPKGESGQKTYDLSDLLTALGLTDFQFSGSLTSNDTEIVSAASLADGTLTLTLSGADSGSALLTGDQVSITVQVKSPVNDSHEETFWLWERDFNMDARNLLDAAANRPDLLEEGEILDSKATVGGYTLTALQTISGKTASDNSEREVTVPYMSPEDQEDTPYILFRQEADGTIQRVPFTQTADGIKFTGKVGDRYFLAKLPYKVSIHGNAVYGETLTAEVAGMTEGTELHYQWTADGVNVGTGSSYVIRGTDVGKTISVIVTVEGYNGNLTASAGVAAKKAVTAAADHVTKVYDGSAKADVRLSVEKVNADDEIEITAPDAVYDDENVGDEKTVRPGTVRITGAAADWYEVTVPENVSGSITRRTLTVKADDQSMTAGGNMPKLTCTVTGLADGDTFTDPALKTTASNTGTPGSYDILVSGGTLTHADCYEVVYQKGTLTIAKRPNTDDSGNGGSDDGSSDNGSSQGSSGGGSGSGNSADGAASGQVQQTQNILTGDASQAEIWLFLFCASAGAAAVLLLFFKRRRKDPIDH